MKIITLNTHSLLEKDYTKKLHQFVRGIAEEKPDIVALQEVNQTIAAPLADAALLTGCVPAQTAVPIRADNHAANAARLLREAGIACSWTCLPVKIGYGKFDEGLAMLVLNREISRVESFLISRTDDYSNWRTRKVLGIQAEGLTDWFCTVHMGWWDDAQEPFPAQWKVLNAALTAKPRHAPVWLMGDFNAPAEVHGEGYDKIAATGWHDTFRYAQEHDAGLTVPGVIDGWRGPMAGTAAAGMRIDQIWCSMPEKIAVSRVVFNGDNHPVVSDHFGVMIETAPHGSEPAEQPGSPWGDIESDPEDDE